ncbi:hypothetical protein WNY61_20155 [Sulfitobacter sp. AS92]|uniref:hypothetical protein n=1 Tax=Sulfitobacter sp. AS92 TaxID=3135783 RepID=UPI0031762C12
MARLRCTAQISTQIGGDLIIFSPEFLREDKTLHDNLPLRPNGLCHVSHLYGTRERQS